MLKNSSLSPLLLASLLGNEFSILGHYTLAKKIAQKQDLPPLYLSILVDDLDNSAAAIDYLTDSRSDEVSISLLLQSQIGAPLLKKQPEKTLTLIKRLLSSQHVDLGLFIPLFFDVEETIETTSSATHSTAPPPPQHTRFSLDLRSRDPKLHVNYHLQENLMNLLVDTLDAAARDPDSAPPVSLQVVTTTLELLFRNGRQLRRRLSELISVEGSDEINRLGKLISAIDRDVEAILRHHVKVSQGGSGSTGRVKCFRSTVESSVFLNRNCRWGPLESEEFRS